MEEGGMSESSKVAIVCEGKRQVHAIDITGNHATLCGLDGDDPHIAVQQSSGGPVERREKINCPICRAVFAQAGRYTRNDFDWRAK
jgi:hypothetical protein